MIDWLTDWLADWLTDWLTDRQIDWLIYLLKCLQEPVYIFKSTPNQKSRKNVGVQILNKKKYKNGRKEYDKTRKKLRWFEFHGIVTF